MFNPNHSVDLPDLFQRYFELCKVHPGEQAIVLTGAGGEGRFRPWCHKAEYAEAATAAFTKMGVPSFHMELPPFARPFIPYSSRTGQRAGVGSTPLDEVPVAVEALCRADFVLDLAALLFSSHLDTIVKSGTRVVMVLDPPESLQRLFPSPALKEALVTATAMLDKGTRRTLRITSKHGTDLTMNIGELDTFYECGYADEPGRWDAFPSGQVCFCPDDGGGEGVIVVAPGDQVVLPYRKYVESPVTLRVQDGYIRDIQGAADAVIMRETIDSFGDPEAYALGHQGLGLHPNGRWVAPLIYGDEGTLMDVRIAKGTFLFGTGPNTENGGTRATRCHFDIPMRDCTVELDGRVLIDAGRIAAQELDLTSSQVGI